MSLNTPRSETAVGRESARELADSLFRHEGSRLVAVLTKIFGIERLELAEDVVQEALIKALQTWPYYGVPRKPAAWLTQTAKNLVLDRLRRERRFQQKENEILAAVERWSDHSEDLDEEIRDDRLRLLFACCHPLIPLESQTSLALKALCGFSPAEIAHAFLTTEAAVLKRLTRARQKLREAGIRLEIPAGEALRPRMQAVLQVLYLLYNEGYKASSGERLIRAELCREAIRLGGLLLEHPVGQVPGTHALLALMWLNSARMPARLDREGQLVTLSDQRRELWDQSMIARGLFHLEQSAQGEELGAYHVQAAIAAHHCLAESYDTTNWTEILRLYDRLLALEPTPVVALNRAVALARVEGPEAGRAALQGLGQTGMLDSYHLFHAVLGDLEQQLGCPEQAAAHFQRALELVDVPSEREHLRARLAEVGGPVCRR